MPGCIIQNFNDLKNNKPEDRGEFTHSSGSVPGTGQFYEPFLQDLDLLWRVNFKISYGEQH